MILVSSAILGGLGTMQAPETEAITPVAENEVVTTNQHNHDGDCINENCPLYETQVVSTPVTEQTTPVVEETPTYQHNHNGNCLNSDCPLYEEHHDEAGNPTDPMHQGKHGNRQYSNGGQHHGRGNGQQGYCNSYQ